MKVVAFDLETVKIEPGKPLPPLVCMSYDTGDGPKIADKHTSADIFRQFYDDGFSFVGHNLAFDMGIMLTHDESLTPIVFDIYDTDRMYDTFIAENLIHIRDGEHKTKSRQRNLAALSAKYLGHKLAKGEDTWRLRYGELLDTPIKDWPAEAIEYSLRDAQTTLSVFEAQDRPADEHNQIRAGLALFLMSARGFRTDPFRVYPLEKKLIRHRDALKRWLQSERFIRSNGQADTKFLRAYVESAYNGSPPYTEPSKRFPHGQISTTADVLKRADDKKLNRLIKYRQNEKLLSTYIPVLKSGTLHAINPSFQVLVETGRTSCREPNLQNLPRNGNIRNCFKAREGFVFLACDYASAELRSLAQVCYTLFGYSNLRDAFIEGKDPHIILGSQLGRVSYEEMAAGLGSEPRFSELRQFAKVGNFGFPGGLGARVFVEYARAMAGIKIDYQASRRIREAWFTAWPEMNPYFLHISELCENSASVVQHVSGRVRGNVSFTQAANSFFQGLVADAAKAAMWALTKQCKDKNHVLYGCFPLMFVHDEVIMEAPEERIHECGVAFQHTMLSEAQKWMPDVPVEGDVHAMRYWYKKAKTIYNEKGELQIWEP